MADPDCRPQMDGHTVDPRRYDVVFLGFPIWWGREPSIVDSFLDAHDLAGKRIIPFCTSGSSGIGNTAERIRGLTCGKADGDEGRRLGRWISVKELLEWTEQLKSE